ncbi:hypothetical protein ACFL6I_02850 [candidate division KSB1 bacterium]
MEKAQAEYTVLVDKYDYLGGQFDFNYIPLTILFDEEGRMVQGARPANIHNENQVSALEEWIKNGENSFLAASASESGAGTSAMRSSGFASPEARKLFWQGVALLDEDGRDEEALPVLKKALELDPDNWLIRKQIWVVEHPEKFYEGDIDTAWQREVMRSKK